MAYCRNCGNQLSETSKFCTNCGNKNDESNELNKPIIKWETLISSRNSDS